MTFAVIVHAFVLVKVEIAQMKHASQETVNGVDLLGLEADGLEAMVDRVEFGSIGDAERAVNVAKIPVLGIVGQVVLELLSVAHEAIVHVVEDVKVALSTAKETEVGQIER